MLLQLTRHLRCTAPLQIRRCSTEQAVKCAEPTRFQARIAQLAAADDSIHAVFEQIDEAVVAVEIQLDFRITPAKFGNDRQQKTVADGRHTDAQPTAR